MFCYLSGGDVDAGEAINGGSGTDTIWLDNAGSINFSSATISDVEALDFVAGSSIATLGGDQIGGGEIDTVSGLGRRRRARRQRGRPGRDLSGVTFSNWRRHRHDHHQRLGPGRHPRRLRPERHDQRRWAATTSMVGGLGDDTYIVDVQRRDRGGAGGGTDLVQSSASFTLDPPRDREPDADRRGRHQRHRQRPRQRHHRQFRRQRALRRRRETLTAWRNARRRQGRHHGGRQRQRHLCRRQRQRRTSEKAGGGIDMVQSSVTFTLAGRTSRT